MSSKVQEKARHELKSAGEGTSEPQEFLGPYLEAPDP